MDDIIATNACGNTEQGANSPKVHPILCADYEKGICACYFLSMSRYGYSFTTAADGKLARDALKMKALDVLITDNQMLCPASLKCVLKVGLQLQELVIKGGSSNVELFLDHANERFQVDQLLQETLGLTALVDIVEHFVSTHHRISYVSESIRAEPVNETGKS